MLKNYSSNIYFNLYRSAAEQLGITYTPLIPNETIGAFTYKNKKLLVIHDTLGINNIVSRILVSYKHRTYQVLKHAGLPHANFTLIEDSSDDIIEPALRVVPSPWVVKPSKGHGGNGVTVGINAVKQIQEAIIFAKKYFKKIIIEEYIQGENYRVIVYKDSILDVIKRIPANVTGDGKSTIQELIDLKNKKRKALQLQAIKIDNELHKEISSQSISLSSILEKGKKIFLRKNSNMSTGGETTRIGIETVDIDNIQLFKKVTNLFDLSLAGIDVIIPDITKSYKKQKAIINEVNKAPGLRAHYLADMKEDNFVAEKIFSLYFNL